MNNNTAKIEDAAREFYRSKTPHLRHPTEGENPIIETDLFSICRAMAEFVGSLRPTELEIASVICKAHFPEPGGFDSVDLYRIEKMEASRKCAREILSITPSN
jgi:hypothetical protein